LNGDFAAEMKTGRLKWTPINIDDEVNRHYVDDYKLYAKSVVVSVARDGKETDWQNLERVWTLVRNEAAFKDYVRGAIRAQLERD
jgi:hypothetical protein